MIKAISNTVLLVMMIFLSSTLYATSQPSVAPAVVVGNDLYNQAGPPTGASTTNITAKFYNSGTLCDTVAIPFRTMITEFIGGSNHCAAVTAVSIIAGTSASASFAGLQVYDPTPVMIGLNGSDSYHAIFVTNQTSGDGSTAPQFNPGTGAVTVFGVLGHLIQEAL